MNTTNLIRILLILFVIDVMQLALLIMHIVQEG